jgi:hypothetical protein
MSQPAYVYYPRGFRRVVSGDVEDAIEDERASRLMDAKVMNSPGDDEVMELYKAWRTADVDTADWSYVSRVIRCAARLIPDLGVFLRLQLTNRRLHGMNFDFLEEIVKVMRAGRSDLSPLTALELMDDSPEPRRISDRRQFNLDLSLSRPPGSEHVGRHPEITLWLAHADSVEAIVCTLYVLFGTKRDA